MGSGQAKKSMEHRGTVANCETGNPPEGWESEGQFRIANLKKLAAGRRQPRDKLGTGGQQELKNKK